MYLLEGMPAPDHATLARFISLHLSECSKKMVAAVTALLYELGEISGKTVFIDGTKIESCANKYTFVWKKWSQKGSDTTLKLKAWKAEVATLTNKKECLCREVRKLREEMSETETIRRCIEQVVWPHEQIKEQTADNDILL